MKGIKENEFKKYNLTDELLLEVGSTSTRKKINWKLNIDFESIRKKQRKKYTQLTLFQKIHNEELTVDLDKSLKGRR